MDNIIDVLFIGHNEVAFEQYEDVIRRMGVDKGAYRDLNLSFIKHHGKAYTLSDLYNTFGPIEPGIGPSDFGEALSLAIAALGTYIQRAGFRFDYVNSFQNEKEVLRNKLQQLALRAVVIPTTLYVESYPILEIIHFVKRYNPEVKIIIGGPYISTQIRCCESIETLKEIFDSIQADIYVNSSQGEETLCKILHHLKNDASLAEIPNIIYRKGREYIFNSTQSENNRLDDHPIDWNLFRENLRKFSMVRTTISCPFNCSFCGYPEHAGPYQTSQIKTIERELDQLAALGRVTSLQFIDDTFNIPKERFKEILRMIIRKKYPFRWNSYYRCQFADQETVELMKESGCEAVILGIESGSQIILDNMNKKARVEDYKRGLTLLREHGIITYASFIIGFPGETEETIQETIDFIEETNPTFFRTQLWYCDPITPIWQSRNQFGLKNSQYNWTHQTMTAIQANDWIEKIFVSVKGSTWLPQYNFNLRGVISLLHRGMELEQVMELIHTFNQGIKDKLQSPDRQEIRPVVFERLKKLCDRVGREKITEKYEADFDF